MCWKRTAGGRRRAFADRELAKHQGRRRKGPVGDLSPADLISAFVKGSGGAGEAAKWHGITRNFRKWRDGLKDGALKRTLTKGGNPETVRSILFSQKPSDVRRLAKNFENGKAAAGSASFRGSHLAQIEGDPEYQR